MKFQHIFFDLDRTLWDFESNSFDTLVELFQQFDLQKLGIPFAKDFIEKYQINNENLWDKYRKGSITKDILRDLRFHITLEEFGIIDKDLSSKLGDFYVTNSPKKTKLFPYSIPILKYLIKKGYHLHIITNGFQEVQIIKLEYSSLISFFKEIITSEAAGVKKPNSKIFQYALDKANAQIESSIMIGDDLAVDIIGAKDFGMSQIYFNPNRLIHHEDIYYEINCLNQLREIL